MRLCAALFILSGCHQSAVQSLYNDERTQCRAFAEEQQRRIGTSNSVAARNAELVSLFSDCMASRGWQVATPRREGEGEDEKPGLTRAEQAAIADANRRAASQKTLPAPRPGAPLATAPEPLPSPPRVLPRASTPAPAVVAPPSYAPPTMQYAPARPPRYVPPAYAPNAPRYIPRMPAAPAKLPPVIRKIPEENIF
jgi:hypothetical protein